MPSFAAHRHYWLRRDYFMKAEHLQDIVSWNICLGLSSVHWPCHQDAQPLLSNMFSGADSSPHLESMGKLDFYPVLWFFPTRGQKTKHIVFSMQQFTSLLSLRWGDRPYFQRKKHAEEAERSVLSVRPMSSLATAPISQRYWCVGGILHVYGSWIWGFSVFCSVFCHSWIIQIHKKWFFWKQNCVWPFVFYI